MFWSNHFLILESENILSKPFLTSKKKKPMAKIAINGMGRIGRAAFKVIMDHPDLELVAVNDLVSSDNVAYLLNFDSVQGKYKHRVTANEGDLSLDNGKKIKYLEERDPANLPWKNLGVDIVLECTGVFTEKAGLQKHIQAGAKVAILSAPPKDDVDIVVFGVNTLDNNLEIISCASCTTNCITPVMEIMNRRIGIKKATMTTIHAYTASQGIVDSPHKKWRRGRAGAVNFVPTSTGAAKATVKALPELEGKFDGSAVRGPVPAGSLSDINFIASRPTSVEEINNIFREEAKSERYKGILGASDDPLVSSDIIMDSRASIVDLEMTQVVDGDLVKVMTWYDNEWGYVNQMVREAADVAKKRNF